MAGSTPASPTVDAAAVASRQARARQCHAVGRGVAAVPPSPSGGGERVVLLAMILAVAFGPLLWRVQINDIDFTAQLQGAELGASAGYRRSRPGPAGAHALRRTHFACCRPGGDDGVCRRRRRGGAFAGISRGSVDAALMWLTDLFLSLPPLPVLLLLIYLFREP